MPVLEYNIKYFKPAYYDDELTIKTITQLKGARIHFEYKTFNQHGVELNNAFTTLVFISKQSLRPISPPDLLIDKLRAT